MQDFIQSFPKLKNTYQSDSWLRLFLKSRLPGEIFHSIEKDLERFGEDVAGPMNELAWQAEQEPPVHIPFDPWGNRIDELKLSAAWNRLHEISATEGLISIGYERKQKEFSRLYQLSKLYLFHPSSAFYSCPLAMADGATRILEVYGNQKLKAKALPHLLSRDSTLFWTSGQWMTEKIGGSDVSQTQTQAKKIDGGYALYGTKWFSSAASAQMALALARIEGASEGNKGLSLFYVETRKADGSLNNITINRLKDKLGTRALPTAELSLDGTFAELVGEEGQGVKTVATMLNITRLYNSICSVAQMQRAMTLIKSYSKLRTTFGQALSEQCLQIEIFADKTVDFALSFLLTFHMADLLGRDECEKATAEEKILLRLLTPVTKLFTGKHAIQLTSEVLESFGGAGYVEDTRIPVLFRDAQVFPIWEGATNVLSLDLLRVLQKNNALTVFLKDIEERLARGSRKLAEIKVEIQKQVLILEEHFRLFQSESPEFWQTGARKLAFSMAQLYSSSLLFELASYYENSSEFMSLKFCLERAIEKPLVSLSFRTSEQQRLAKNLMEF